MDHKTLFDSYPRRRKVALANREPSALAEILYLSAAQQKAILWWADHYVAGIPASVASKKSPARKPVLQPYPASGPKRSKKAAKERRRALHAATVEVLRDPGVILAKQLGIAVAPPASILAVLFPCKSEG